jgi:hypothetical protein
MVDYDIDVAELVKKYFPNSGKTYRENLCSDIGYFEYGLLGRENLRLFKK